MSARRRRVGEQRHLAAVLHGHGDVALVLRAVAADPTRADLAAVGDVLAKKAGVLVVDVGHLVLAELADLLLELAGRWLGHRCSFSCEEVFESVGLEGGLVGPAAATGGRASDGRARPRVIAGTAAGSAAAVGAAARGAAEATPAAATRGLGDLRGGPAQGRTDLVDDELVDGALLAFLRLVRALLQPALDDHG